MRRFLLCFLTMVGSSIFVSCEGQTNLPKEFPANAEITYKSEGGFAPHFYSIVISGKTLKVTDQPAETPQTGESKRVEWEATLADDELKDIYRVFIENKFDSIKPGTGSEADDGMFRSIELKFGGKRFYTIVGDGIKTTKDQADRFNNIENALAKLVKKYGRKEA